jgi:uncharacterized membrane protein
MEQAISVVGSILILVAYAANQQGMLDRAHPAYSWLNLIGSLILAVIAFRANLWGFVLLEGVWAAVSVPGVLRARSSAA